MIFIPGNVPSSKNSKVATKKGVFHSKTVRKYLQKIGVKHFSCRSGVKEYVGRENIFKKSCSNGDFDNIQYPAKIKMHFVRDSRRKFDFHNACQIVFDLLVAHGFIEDDNMDCVIPFPMVVNGKWYSIDRHDPGVIISVEST